MQLTYFDSQPAHVTSVATIPETATLSGSRESVASFLMEPAVYWQGRLDFLVLICQMVVLQNLAELPATFEHKLPHLIQHSLGPKGPLPPVLYAMVSKVQRLFASPPGGDQRLMPDDSYVLDMVVKLLKDFTLFFAKPVAGG